MAGKVYDAIVIGARCAGSPTAMLLARKGYQVLVVDRAKFPSDTISTHLIHPPGVAALRRWGLLDRLAATGCPAIETYSFNLGPLVLQGSPGTKDSPVSYGPRRTVLDQLLVDAAREAGAEVREEFAVEEIVFEDGRVAGICGHGKGGASVTERARVVIGADGLHSTLARAVSPEQYREQPALEAGYYTYFSGVPTPSMEAYDRGDRAWAAWPTNDGLLLVVVSWPIAEFETNKQDVEGAFFRSLDKAPEFAARVRAGKREERFYGMTVPNYFRKPYGPGWALVGDAGYNKDFITAQGISDAFRDAESCVAALDQSFQGGRTFDDAMAERHATRDQHVSAMYEFTLQFASMTPPTPEKLQLFAAIHGNREAMDGFARVIAGVTSPAEFFSEENVGKIFAAAQSQGARAQQPISGRSS
jgi:2-polyprenyl-6-methoxyphenol hydroxylase-like FAD-dependent oxidoreductase